MVYMAPRAQIIIKNIKIKINLSQGDYVISVFPSHNCFAGRTNLSDLFAEPFLPRTINNPPVALSGALTRVACAQDRACSKSQITD